MAKLYNLEENIPKDDIYPSVEEIVELTRQKFGAKFTRKEFLRLMTVLASIGLIGGVKRIVDIEYGDWRDYATPKERLIEVAMMYPKPFEFGCYPDFEKSSNPWQNADLLKEAAGTENFIGTFFNIEWADVQSYPGKMDAFIELLHYIHYVRSSKALISIHIGVDPNNHHPFHPINANWMQYHVNALYDALDRECPFAIEERTFYEFDILRKFGFLYGPADNFKGEEHRLGFQRTVKIFHERGLQSRYPRDLGFCPSIWNDVSNYFIYPQNGVQVFKKAGMDGYDIFPGKLQDWINMEISFEGWLQLLLCYFVGKRSPEQVFGPPIKSLMKLTRGNIPLYIYEMGSKTGDVEWLDYTLWLIAAYGGDGAIQFIYDKEYQIVEQEKFFEGNWAANIHKVAERYSETIPMLNSRYRLT